MAANSRKIYFFVPETATKYFAKVLSSIWIFANSFLKISMYVGNLWRVFQVKPKAISGTNVTG